MDKVLPNEMIESDSIDKETISVSDDYVLIGDSSSKSDREERLVHVYGNINPYPWEKVSNFVTKDEMVPCESSTANNTTKTYYYQLASE